jgi:trk system potassium uptake protein TrkH
MLAFALLSVGVAASGVDVLSAFTGVAQALANVGHGLGPLIGPRGMFSLLPESAKWLLTLAMLLGRLELMAVLVLFSPGFWRA